MPDRFRFVPQQSPLAAVILSRHGIDHEAMLKNNSVYLVLDFGSDHERLLARSDVTVNLLLRLGGRFAFSDICYRRFLPFSAMRPMDSSPATATG